MLPKFSGMIFNLIFSEEIIQYQRTFAPQVQMPSKNQASPMHPSLSRAFQRHQEHDLKQHPGWWISNKTTFIHR
jgi:hypothetical protein